MIAFLSARPDLPLGCGPGGACRKPLIPQREQTPSSSDDEDDASEGIRAAFEDDEDDGLEVISDVEDERTGNTPPAVPQVQVCLLHRVHALPMEATFAAGLST